ncbi:MAG: hypothetical protein IJM09_07625, partial [Neisseriaceae bacterium]|nr:hypothetical protein [Neisseriaceae bacterium]
VYFTTRIYDDNSAAAATQKFVPWNNAWTKPEDWEKNGWEKVSSNISSTRNQMCSSDKEDKKAGKNGWRFMGQIDHKDGTPETSYSGTCNNTATTVKTDVDTYKSTCDYEVSEEMTLQSKVAPGITKTSSSLIQLSVLNGGAIFPKKKNTSYMLMDYDENNADGSGYLGNDSITASESYEGLISMTIADPTRRGINSDKHGNVYSRGEYTDLNANPVKGRVDVFDSDNPCRPSVTGHQADAHISNTVSGPDYKQINGTTASINCLRRISWREIY